MISTTNTKKERRKKVVNELMTKEKKEKRKRIYKERKSSKKKQRVGEKSLSEK
jgi:hypothetical protein